MCSGTGCFASGGKPSVGAVKRAGSPGLVALRLPTNGFLVLRSSIHIPKFVSPLVIQDKSRMRRRACTDLCGLRLETHEVQSPEMEAARRSLASSRVPSLAVSGDGHCEAWTGRLQAETTVNGNVAPKSIVMEVADPIRSGEGGSSGMRHGECTELLPGCVRQHATKGFHGNKGEPSGSSLACRVRQAEQARKI